MNLYEFINKTIGTIQALPNGRQEGQCVSLIQQYLIQVFNIPFKARGHAKDFRQILPLRCIPKGRGCRPGSVYLPKAGRGHGRQHFRHLRKQTIDHPHHAPQSEGIRPIILPHFCG